MEQPVHFRRRPGRPKGRSVEPSVLLEEFLGRPASNKSFLQRLGLK